MENENHIPQGYALITGASAGIGYELAKVFAENGHDLILVARTQSKLEELAKLLVKSHPIKVKVLVKDLSKASDRNSLFDDLKNEELHVETLVNNAGFGLGGEFVKQDINRQLEMIQLNISALTHLARLFLPQMLEKKSGYILNVASTAAFVPGPLMAIYYATKAFVASLSEALASELQGTGVIVSALCPGPTKTEFQKVAEIQSSKLFDVGVMEARAVAEFGYTQLIKGKVIAIPGFRNKFLAMSSVFAPRSLLVKTVKQLNSNRTS
jgi:short-subunit dehydrogenase